MKLSALASIIKDCGHCSQITAANGHRFISTGYAVYNMDGYPKAQNKNELAAMLSIPSKKVEDIYFEEERAENNIYYGVSLADDPDNEEPVDKLNTSIVTCLLADSRTKKISKKQTDVFKKALAREIEEEAKKRTRFSICCDYEPCKVLFVAAHEAGIPTANFPFKTMMFINEEDGVVVRDGYGAPPVKI